MLNETFELSESMKAAGIVTESWHNDYGTCPNNKTFRMLISENGLVADMEAMADIEEIRFLRKWEVSNGTSFPAFNVMPLLLATTQKDKDNVSTLKKTLKSQNGVDENQARTLVDDLYNTCKRLWGKSEIERIDRCLKSHPNRLAQILGTAPEDFKGIGELIRRSGLLDADALVKSIKTNVIKRIVQSPNDANVWIDSLLVSAAASVKSVKKVSLMLEVADSSSFKYPANHKKVQEWVNSRLMADNMPVLAENGTSQQDAFGWPFAEADAEKKFPEAELKMILGKVTLRAMSSESPCQARYGKTDAKSFPCGRETRQVMKNSLEWLGKADRKGKTWQNVSDACGYDRGVLFAYPSELPEDPPELASLFVSEESVDRDGARFEAAAARVVPALDGIVKKHPNTEIRVFVLAKPDGYRTKVLVSRNYSARDMINAAQYWQEGCKNIPPISLNIDATGGVTPLIPFPAEVVRCLNIAWLQSGVRTKPVHGLGIGDGIALLMETEPRSKAIVGRALQLAVTNTGPLFLALGHADHRHDGSFKWNKDTAKYRKHACLLPSLLGLLLYKRNYTKGGYMHTSPFLVGQMLALADTLHKEYCQHVRKKETPPQLIGNALMTTALENPTAGLARISERIAPYQAWANTATEDGVELAKWALQQLGQITRELGEQALPELCNDADKAQMLLGYLSRPEKNDPNSGKKPSKEEE